MSARLSGAAKAMLGKAGCTEVGDDCIMLFNSDITVLLSGRAVLDLNRQARDLTEDSDAHKPTQIKRCAAARDGDCSHAQCPQLRDNEPHASGRHCPLDTQGDDECTTCFHSPGCPCGRLIQGRKRNDARTHAMPVLRE